MSNHSKYMTPPTVRTCSCDLKLGACVGENQAREWGVLCQVMMEREIRNAPPQPFVAVSKDTLRPVLKQRGQEYGDYASMAIAIQAIKNAIRDWNTKGLPATHMEALEMIATKIGRILTGNPNNEDSWRDIAGYATLVADRIPKAAARPIRACEGIIIPDGWLADVRKENPSQNWIGPNAQYVNGSIHDLYRYLGKTA